MTTMIEEKKKDPLQRYRVYGFVEEGSSGKQRYGTCPLCLKEGKFYVNSENLLWDCKVCGAKGNWERFVKLVYDQSKIAVLHDKKLLEPLAENRNLPLDILLRYGLGKFHDKYIIPIFNENGQILGIRQYALGDRLISSTGSTAGLFGVQDLMLVSKGVPVYLCEGEWDAMAMRWLLTKCRKDGVVVGVPGASTFKMEWVSMFEGRKVHTLYDNDIAGENGEELCKERLKGVVSSMTFLHWPPKLKEGFDIRDFVIEEISNPRKAMDELISLFRTQTRKELQNPKPNQPTPTAPNYPAVLNPVDENLSPITVDELFDVFKKWLYLKNMDAVWMVMAVILSNYLDGDPLWMFLVAPPGGAKTEILNSLMGYPEGCYFTSSLTPHALISGATFSRSDPSLIPKLDGMSLIVKDWTSILAKRDTEKEEIYGILRDAYDGKCGKNFGNGVARHYKSRFTVLSAVTPAIYESSEQYTALGERFLKYSMGENLEHDFEESIIRKAIDNVNKETNMREEIQSAMRRYLVNRIADIKANPVVPEIPEEIQKKIISLAQFGARMRGTVSRDRYRPDMVMARPSAEIGSRLGKQLAKAAKSLAMVYGRKEVTEAEYRMVKKIMQDTISQRNEDIVRKIFMESPTIDDTLSTKQISFLTRYTQSTTQRVLSDMDMLKIVMKQGNQSRYEWTLTPYIRGMIEKSEIYHTNGKVKEEIS